MSTQNNRSLLRLAEVDLGMCSMALDNVHIDVKYGDMAAYHLQQAIEKALKFWLSVLGVDPNYIHSITALLTKLNAEGIEAPEWLELNASIIDLFESKTRYTIEVVSSKKHVQRLYEQCSELIKTLYEKYIPQAGAGMDGDKVWSREVLSKSLVNANYISLQYADDLVTYLLGKLPIKEIQGATNDDVLNKFFMIGLETEISKFLSSKKYL